jgi:hypothetical protein
MGGPAAVSRLIVSVIENAFDFLIIGSRAHIREKLSKIVPPLRTYGYSARAIQRKPSVRRTVASLFHALPYFKSSFKNWVSRLPVIPDGVSNVLRAKATTALGVTLSKIPNPVHTQISAVAFAPYFCAYETCSGSMYGLHSD